MTDTPTPQNLPENQPANRAAYDALEPALMAWRAGLQAKANRVPCPHDHWTRIQGIQVCMDCGRPKEIEKG